MARIDLSSAGVSVSYAVETAAGTMPTTGYTKLTGIRAIPDMNQAPSTLDSTTLDELVSKTSIPGLKEAAGALPFSANMTQAFISEWDALMTAFDTGRESGLSTWFVVAIPGITEAFYFPGEPSPLGVPAIEVDSVLTIDAYITQTGETVRAAKPTDAAGE